MEVVYPSMQLVAVCRLDCLNPVDIWAVTGSRNSTSVNEIDDFNIVAKSGNLVTSRFSAQIRKVEARLGKLRQA